MADQISRMVRRHDAKINAFSRLIDAAIIGCTLVALVSVLKLSWVPLYSWLLLISIVLFSFLSESSHSKSWRDISLRAEVTSVGSNWLEWKQARLALAVLSLPILCEHMATRKSCTTDGASQYLLYKRS